MQDVPIQSSFSPNRQPNSVSDQQSTSSVVSTILIRGILLVITGVGALATIFGVVSIVTGKPLEYKLPAIPLIFSRYFYTVDQDKAISALRDAEYGVVARLKVVKAVSPDEVVIGTILRDENDSIIIASGVERTGEFDATWHIYIDPNYAKRMFTDIAPDQAQTAKHRVINQQVLESFLANSPKQGQETLTLESTFPEFGQEGSQEYMLVQLK